jgi:hypothetical protein
MYDKCLNHLIFLNFTTLITYTRSINVSSFSVTCLLFHYYPY